MTCRTWEVLLVLALALPCTLASPFMRRLKIPPPTPAPTPKLPPCPPKPTITTISDIKLHLMLPPDKVKVTDNHIPGTYDVPGLNCTEQEDGDGMVSEPVLYDHWKLHIIMACTVTAAVEFVLIIFIIIYWRQIRWTLRKITCPFDNCRRSGHEAMEQDNDGAEDTSDLDPDSRSPREHGLSQADAGSVYDIVHTFSPPRQSRVQSAMDDPAESTDVAIPGPSGIKSAQTIEKCTFKVISHTYSDESLSDDNEAIRQVNPSPSHNATAKNRVKNAKLNAQSPKGKCGYHNVSDSQEERDPLMGRTFEMNPLSKRVSTDISLNDFNQSQGSIDLQTLINSPNHSWNTKGKQPIKSSRTNQAQKHCSQMEENPKRDSSCKQCDSLKCDKGLPILTNQSTADNRVQNPNSFCVETEAEVHCEKI